MAHAPDEDLLAIAHVTRPHGVHGELSALALAPPVVEPGPLIVDRTLAVRDRNGRVAMRRGKAVRMHQGRWLITLEGVDSRDAADALRGHDLCLRRDELPPLPEGWYWEADLDGARVIDARHGELGFARGLDLGQPQPRLVIETHGKKATMPWVRAFVTRVDVAAHEIHTDLPDDMPGLTD